MVLKVNFESDDEVGEDDAHGEINEDTDEDNDDFGDEADASMVVSANLTNESGGINLPKNKRLHPREIDAYWLQRNLSKAYEDAMTSQKKAEEVLEILKTTEENELKCEDQLVKLLGLNQFDFIKVQSRFLSLFALLISSCFFRLFARIVKWFSIVHCWLELKVVKSVKRLKKR